MVQENCGVGGLLRQLFRIEHLNYKSRGTNFKRGNIHLMQGWSELMVAPL